MLAHFVNLYLKLLVILAPFFVLSVFLSMTQQFGAGARQRIARKFTLAVVVVAFVLYLFGSYIFELFGITLDAFRIGAGAVLFLSAIAMIQGDAAAAPGDQGEAIAVVPLAIPVTVGPGTIGALLVMGAAEVSSLAERLIACAALLAACLSVGALLMTAGRIERALGQQGLVILTKLTGLFVASIAAQIFFTGLKNFLGL